MKKLFTALFAVISATVLLCCFAACGDGTDPSGDDSQGGGKGTRYSIQAPEESDLFEVTGLPDGAYEGDSVKFGVTLAHPDDSVIQSVGLKAQSGDTQLTAGGDGKYTFEMPAEPVRVVVEVGYYPDNDTDNFLSWDSSNVLEIEKWQAAFEGDQYYDFADNAEIGSTITSQPSQSPANMAITSHTESAFSLDQDVVPDSALSVEVIYSDGNQASGFVVNIDRTRVSAGTAKIVLVVNNGHKFGDKATLVCTVTVTEPEPLEQVDTWTETVVFDVSAIVDNAETEKMAFVFDDLDYEEGMYLRPSQMIDFEDCTVEDGKVSFEIEYAVGHRYELSFHFYASIQPASPTVSFDGEADGGQFAAGVVTFDKDNGSLTLRLS